jgi:hypothetical protein
MNPLRSIKLIKNADRKNQRRKLPVKLAINATRWSRTVRSWIVEFQGRELDTDASGLPTFDSLFKDPSPSSPETNPAPVKEEKHAAS